MPGRVPASYGILVGNRHGSILHSRWVKQDASSCPLFKAGVACCLPTCAQGFSVPVTGDSCVGFGMFWALWILLGVFVHMVSFGFAELPVVHRTWFFSVCLTLDTPFGRRSVGALP